MAYPNAEGMVDESRQLASRVLTALAAPVVVLAMVVLAVLAALGFYLAALGQGFWLLCRGIPGWVWALKSKPVLRKPHFLESRSPTHFEGP